MYSCTSPNAKIAAGNITPLDDQDTY